jgi:hypothetical protein
VLGTEEGGVTTAARAAAAIIAAEITPVLQMVNFTFFALAARFPPLARPFILPIIFSSLKIQNIQTFTSTFLVHSNAFQAVCWFRKNWRTGVDEITAPPVKPLDW